MIHTGYEDCPVRPLHDPCHTGDPSFGAPLAAMTALTVRAAWRKQVRGTEDGQPDGHALAAEQIRKHGRDRYPGIPAQWRKVLDELGELGEALMYQAANQPDPSPDAQARVRAEYADVGLALYELGNKLVLDLIACMRELVAGDERTFALESGMSRQAAEDLEQGRK